MKKIQYIGTGILIKGIKFDPKHNNGLYNIDDTLADYILKTFKRDFNLIENIPDTKKTIKTADADKVETNNTEVEKKRTTTRRKKKTDNSIKE